MFKDSEFENFRKFDKMMKKDDHGAGKNKLRKELKALYTIAMVNVSIYALGLIALVFILENGGSAKGMYVILASGVAIGIQIIALISKLKKDLHFT